MLADLLRRVAPFTTAALLVTLGYLGWEYAARSTAGRGAERSGRKQRPNLSGYPGAETKELKILQFYGFPSILREGDRATLCYGVANAESVRIEPATEATAPALNRCLVIEPEETTTYTLTASAGRETATASFMLQVAPDPDKQPKIVYFVKGRKQRDGERTIQTLCFETRNAREVSITPRLFPPGPLFRGCFYAAPEKTTTYALTVTDDRGRKARRELTVEVP